MFLRLDLHAKIQHDKQVLQTFLVIAEGRRSVPEGPALEILRATLKRVVRGPAHFNRPMLRRVRRRTRHFEIRTEVDLDPRLACSMTRMTLCAAGYSGLPRAASDALNRRGVLPHQVPITALGGRAQDAFLLTGHGDTPLNDAGLQKRIAGGLRQRVTKLCEPARAA